MNHLHILLICMTLWSIRADNQTNCPGPLAFYEAIGCKPINNAYVNGCAYRYNCDEVKSLPLSKCYVNRKAYDVGEPLKEEDANPCDIQCTCQATADDGVSKFNCSTVDCFDATRPDCYRIGSPLACCPGEEICSEDPGDRAKCNVDGKVYLDGDDFKVESDPDLNCVCQQGYKGENVEPFCAKPKHPYCDPLFTAPAVIKGNCAPVYYSSQSPQTDCPVQFRCQNQQDMVIESNEPKDTQKADIVCHFGSLTMGYGDELNRATDNSSVCVKCVCEVEPTPTCQRLPGSECDATSNSNFLERLQDFGSSVVTKLRNNLTLNRN